MSDTIPNFDGQFNGSVTIGQFISSIEEHALCENLIEDQVKELCLSKLSAAALNVYYSHATESWTDVKVVLMNAFAVKLSIKEKVEIRKKLKQETSEDVEDFYYRCLQAQYLVSDDVRDVAFEREVLLNFLLGLHHTIQENVLTANCSSAEEFILEAKKCLVVPKSECFEPEIKPEPIDDYFEECANDNTSGLQSDYPEEGKFDPSNTLNSPDFDAYDEEKPLIKKTKPSKVDKNNKIELKPKKYKCMIYQCDKSFRTPKGREKHIDIHHKQDKRQCDICNEVCLDVVHLGRHMVQKHCSKNDQNQYVCYYCNDYKRRVLRHVRRHIMAVHWGMNIYIACTLGCGQEFEEKEIMLRHVASKHSNEKTFLCDKCDVAYKSRNGLNLHMASKHEKQIAVKCEECGKTFANAIRLKVHITNSHIQTKTFVCDTCGKSFNSKHYMEQHRRLTHSTAEEKEKMKIACDYADCKYRGMTKRFVQKHVNIVHLKIRNHVCPHCSKAFVDVKNLKEHINGIHLGIKPLKCPNCDYFATAYSTVLREHRNIVHGSQRFECPVENCNHVANYKGNLRKHMKNVHNKVLD